MSRSLIRQLEQIRRSATYDDTVASVNTQAIAEPSVSGSLEQDLNVIRTLMKDLKGTTNWYDSLGSFSEQNYVSSASDILTNINALDTNLKDLSDSLLAGVGEKYVESVSVAISANTEHTLPYSLTYTPDSTAGQEGSNMDVYLDGQLLAADTGVSGVNADRDYGETSTSGITFRMDVQVGRNITYLIRE